MSLKKPDRHVSLSGLSFVCDICGQELDVYQPLVALAGNGSSSAFQTGFIHPFTLDNPDRSYHAVPHTVKFGPWELCRWDSLLCNKWDGRARPGCALHPDCLQVFMRHCTARDPLDILWQTCAWRRVPWTGAPIPEIQLLPRPGWHFQDAFLSCASRCGLKGLDTLPQVVIGTILEFLPRDDFFWRCVTAMHMANSLSTVAEQPLRIVPLSWLVSWERGTPPKVAAEEGLPRFLRFTIDRDGMSKVERMAERPQFTRTRFDDKVFVVEHDDAFGASLAMFRNGLLKLSMLDDFEEYKWSVWDTPTPPDLTHCLVKPEKPIAMLRYHSIDLNTVTGITFFVLFTDIFAVHAHSRARPCAMATYQFYRRRIRDLERYGAWVYVPLPPSDTVVSCGPLVNRDFPSEELSHGRSPCRYLIRMRLSGETIVGRYIDRDNRQISDPRNPARYAFLINRVEHPPKDLLYNTGANWPKSCISIIATCSEQGQNGILEEPWHCPPADHGSQAIDLHSHAPLENIRRVRMFYYSDQSAQYCKGMLVDYDDGGQRALGQCRLHVDPSKTFERPSRIAFLRVPGPHCPRVIVLFDGLPSADDPRLDEWLYYEMKGTLDFWFSANHEYVVVRGGTETPQMELWKEVPREELREDS